MYNLTKKLLLTTKITKIQNIYKYLYTYAAAALKFKILLRIGAS